MLKAMFRKAAKTAHPDKGGSEAKMASLSVNEAYEVLSNSGGCGVAWAVGYGLWLPVFGFLPLLLLDF